ncbi:hypothetical protein EDD11_009335 [Mortierella claussenii]|nr:hypothetical protein EDD11_009335 [Mortierella claussenii]
MSDTYSNNPHGYLRGHNKSHGQSQEDHTLSTEDLTRKLEELQAQQEQERLHRAHETVVRHEHHHHSHSHSHGGKPIKIDAGLQKRAQETLHEILERLERQKLESDLLTHNAAPGMEDNGSGRTMHVHRLSPALLDQEGDLGRYRSLRQSHGNANLRHS